MNPKARNPVAPEIEVAVSPGGSRERWLLMIFQLPAKPAYLRVKFWRRLQSLGAVAVKNAVYALPANAEAQEDFGWLAKEIAEAGGEVLICEARLVEGMTDAEVRVLFDRARDADYEALAEEARQLAAELDEAARSGEAPGGDARSRLARLRSRLDQAVAIDFFDAHGRQTVEGLLAGLTARLAEGDPDARPAPPPADPPPVAPGADRRHRLLRRPRPAGHRGAAGRPRGAVGRGRRA